jgi:Na+/proline symporter
VGANTAVLAALSVYFIAILVLAWFSRAGEHGEGFVIGERKMSAFATMASLAAGMRDGSGIVIWVSLGATMGFAPLWLLAGLMVALLIHGYQALVVRKKAGERGYITMVDLIADSFGPWTARTMAVIMSVMTLFYAAGQLYISGRILSIILSIPMAAALAVSALTVGTYLLLGGYRTLMRTDVLRRLRAISSRKSLSTSRSRQLFSQL